MACRAPLPVPAVGVTGPGRLFSSLLFSPRISRSCTHRTRTAGRSWVTSKFIVATRSGSNTAYGGAVCAEVAADGDCGPTSKSPKNYVVREAELDEELWAAACLRAEGYCEEQPYVRYIESYKKRFAEQEFYALKRRLLGRHGQSFRCICLVAVRSQRHQTYATDGIQREANLENVLGTLDLSIRQLSPGEAFPGDSIRATLCTSTRDVEGCPCYGYIANVCVAKSARRKGIASCLLCRALKVANDWGLKEIYVHVSSSNGAAIRLYCNYKFKDMPAGAVRVGFQNINLLQRML